MTSEQLPRQKVIELVLAFPNGEFQTEIAHQMSVEREYEYDEVAALFDVEDRAETWLRDGHKASSKLLRIARQVLIDIGFYRPMSDEEVRSILVSSGRSPWVFKHKGVPYTSDEAAESWMFPETLEDGQESNT